ncbi:orotidine-5'-phosphate decarboxylase [Alkaliphilus peptidifermentans]|uniref:Orotidine 5'-phosphate decarboxylase n=1 Tax=Alkaliphilus peptidifermentans DSM 18978 TaxID=1120976 RepID=A0A1G5GIM7_9FIRM|nr:orotidine-5'-phosphate decarboxylase [Alkaliphilus peptidifermentans]SCY51199.1 orotidine-5'-phosphate decarboxylase [Alkaliphilus peptidifermentans DSM 18978]
MIDRLIAKIEETQNPTVVGLDPRLSFIPKWIKEESYEEHGKTPKGAAKAFLHFNKEIIDAIYDLIPAVKPQIAMYEQYGSHGIDAYIETIEYCKQKGLIIIGDIKRGDIASTAEAYSHGHIGKVDIEGDRFEIYKEDSITINPYLGYDSIEPFLADCSNYDKGLFVLVKTSNPNSGQIQNLEVGGIKLYERMGQLVSEWGEGLIGKRSYSSIGAVVGATHPEEAKNLRRIMPHTYFLVPGYGAQGGTAADLAGCFNKDGLGAIINSSRGIIAAHNDKVNQNKYTEKEFAQAAREAVIKMKLDLQQVLNTIV